MRVHELAKQLNVQPKDMITLLHELGFNEIKNNFNAVSQAMVKAATDKVHGPEKPATPAKPKVAIHRPAPPPAPSAPPAPKPTVVAAEPPRPLASVEAPQPEQAQAPAAEAPAAPVAPPTPTPPAAPPLRPAQAAAQAHRSVTPSAATARPVTPPLPPAAHERGPVPQFRSVRPQAPQQPAAPQQPQQQPHQPQQQQPAAMHQPQGPAHAPRPQAPQPPRPQQPMARPMGPGGPGRPAPGPGGGPARPAAQTPGQAPAGAPSGPRPGGPGGRRDSWKDKDKDKENTNKLFAAGGSGKRGRGKRGRDREEAEVNVALLTKHIKLPGSVTVKELADKMGVKETEIIKRLFMKGIMATINQTLELETAEMIATEMEYTVEVVNPNEEEAVVEVEEENPADLKHRAPVVTIMGHVDHGKTSLLDAIRKTNVTAGEAGGITQHIGAYQVKINEQVITFLDTPGHEAFTAMRARGAKATDIAILVVAADDGVKPQTIEAINHAKEAGVQILVAINKIDKPGANPDQVKQQLTEYGLVAEEWGGQTIMVPVSAKQKVGLEDLLEMILLVAEVLELKANPKKPAKGLIIEAQLDKGMGPVATVLVQNGTLRIGDNFVVGAIAGKVRAMINDKGKRVREAGPSQPVEVLGMPTVPAAGDIFQVMEDEKSAKAVAGQRAEYDRNQRLQATRHISLNDVYSRIQEGKIKDLKVILKADVKGSGEALESSLSKISAKDGDVQVRVIHNGTGDVSEADVMLAAASDAIVIAFNVKADDRARARAATDGVDIREYNIIYKAIEDMEAALQGMLEPEYEEVFTGRAEVRATFKVGKQDVIAGCMVTEGKIQRGGIAKVLRGGTELHKGKLDSLKRFKDDVKEVAQGYECGMSFDGFNDLQEGDQIEVFQLQLKK